MSARRPSAPDAAPQDTGAEPRRHSTQRLLPLRHPGRGAHYDLYPSFPIQGGRIEIGWDSIAALADESPLLLIECGSGVDDQDATRSLEGALRARGRTPVVRRTASVLRIGDAIGARVATSLQEEDPVFGRRYDGDLEELLDRDALRALGAPEPGADIVVVLGAGAGLAHDDAPLAYLEVPRNEQQYRARAGALTHLAGALADGPKAAYKRLYFFEWPLLERHKARFWGRIDRFADVQRAVCVSVSGAALRRSLDAMAHAPFRARPWFEPGAWGGHWLERVVPDLPRDVPNYAWSFELITPENGLLLEDDGLLLETGFDSLMIHAAHQVLGVGTERFGRTFPIRVDHLDTVRGGNLSVQVHPRPDYACAAFGEPFTQDETYYILDAEDDATVYLGFQEGVTPEGWAAAAHASHTSGTPLDVSQWIRTFPAHPGDLYLIPSGTIHASGAGTLVLEISATPYIFTFKMYDWLRVDLDGTPRPLNIERGLANLVAERAGARVDEELVSRPYELAAGHGWRHEHLPTHAEHFYDVHRHTFDGAIELETHGSPLVLNLVRGRRIRADGAAGASLAVRYAETFVIPAAARRVRLVNEGGEPATVVCAFLKQERA